MKNGYVVRVSKPSDLDMISALLMESYGEILPLSYDPSTLDWALPLMTKANPGLVGSGRHFTASDTQGQAIGCGGWSAERPGTGEIEKGLGHLRHFATHPDWLGLGVGREIYNRCRDAATEIGIKRFECYSSLNAEDFYKALGLNSIRRLDVAMGPNNLFPAVLMEGEVRTPEQ